MLHSTPTVVGLIRVKDHLYQLEDKNTRGLNMGKPIIPNMRTWPRNLSTSQGGGLSTTQYGGMSTSQYGGASTSQYGGLSTSQYGGMSTSQYGGLSTS